MAAKTGNSYTTGTTADSVEILTASPGFSTIWLRQWPTSGNGSVAAKTGNTYISGTMTDRMIIPTANLGVFDHVRLEETDPWLLRQRPTTGNSNMDVLGANLAIYGNRSLSQSFG